MPGSCCADAPAAAWGPGGKGNRLRRTIGRPGAGWIPRLALAALAGLAWLTPGLGAAQTTSTPTATPTATPTRTSTATRTSTRAAALGFSPASSSIGSCGTTHVLVTVDDATGIQAFDFRVAFPGARVVLTSVSPGALLSGCTVLTGPATPTSSSPLIASVSCLAARSGGGTLLDLTFQGTSNGTGALGITNCFLQEGAFGCLPGTGDISVSGCASPTFSPTATLTPTSSSTATRTGTATATPSRTATDTPSVTPTPTFHLCGNIVYYAGGGPVPDIFVDGGPDVAGPVASTVTTDADGAFRMGGVPAGPWSLRPRLVDSRLRLAAGLSSVDAVWIQQRVVRSRTFDARQMLAADTTGNGTLSSVDAVQVQRFLVSAIEHLPVAVECQSDWVFVPLAGPAGNPTPIPPHTTAPCGVGAVAYASLSGSAAGQDFEAVLFGDVTGSWVASGGGASSLEALLDQVEGEGEGEGTGPVASVRPPPCAGADACVTVQPEALAVDGCASTQVVVTAANLAEVHAVDLTIAVPGQVQVVSVERAELSLGRECSLVFNAADEALRISLACSRPIRGGGALVSVTLRGVADGSGILLPAECDLEEGRVGCAARGAGVSVRGCGAF